MEKEQKTGEMRERSQNNLDCRDCHLAAGHDTVTTGTSLALSGRRFAQRKRVKAGQGYTAALHRGKVFFVTVSFSRRKTQDEKQLVCK